MVTFKRVYDEREAQIVSIARFTISQLENSAQELGRITQIQSSLKMLVEFDKQVRAIENFVSQIPDKAVQQDLTERLNSLLESLGAVFSKLDILVNQQVNIIYADIDAAVLATIKEYEDLLDRLFVYQQVVGLSIWPEDSHSKDRWETSYDILEQKKLLIP